MVNETIPRSLGFRPGGGFVGAALLSLLCLLPLACTKLKPARLVPNDTEFRGRTDSLAQAYTTMNVDQIMTFYAPDTYSLSFDLPYKFDSDAGSHRERLVRFLDKVQNVHVTAAPNLEVWRDERRVWTTRVFTATGTMKNGDSFRFDGEYSAIWEQRGTAWAIVYEHFWGPMAQLTPAPTPTPAPVAEAPPPPPPAPPSLEANLRDIFFDFDKWDIRNDQVPTLTANALLLKQHPTAVISLEGHCDERGSIGYNRVLGQRRADETRRYLISLGVEPERLQAVSLGKDRPIAAGRGETIWSQNRRSHFVVISH